MSSQSYDALLSTWDHVYYLPPDISELAPPNPSQTCLNSIYLPEGMEGLVELGGCIHTEMFYLPALQTVAHPGSNRARFRATS